MSRKYSQKGYQDEERSGREPRPASRSEKRDGPRGRGLGSPTGSTFRCRDCGTELNAAAALELEPEAVCASCGAALHSCVNCTSFDPSARYECRQELEAPERSKTRANHCRHWSAKLVAELGKSKSKSGGGGAGGKDPRAAFDALFD